MSDYIRSCAYRKNMIEDQEAANRQYTQSCNGFYTKFCQCQKNGKRGDRKHEPVLPYTWFERLDKFGFCILIENRVFFYCIDACHCTLFDHRQSLRYALPDNLPLVFAKYLVRIFKNLRCHLFLNYRQGRQHCQGKCKGIHAYGIAENPA